MPVTGNKSLLNYSLSIRQCADGFSFFVHSIGSGQLVLSDYFHTEEDEDPRQALERLLKSNTVTCREYERVVLFSDAQTTHLPMDEFRREDIVALYRLAFSGNSVRPEDVRYQILPSLELVELYQMPASYEETLREFYPQASIQNIQASMLHYLARVSQGSYNSTTFHACVDGKNTLVVAFRQGRLLFANNFHTANEAERTYHILYVWRTLEMDALHDTCNLYGVSPELLSEIKRFIVTVKNTDIPTLIDL